VGMIPDLVMEGVAFRGQLIALPGAPEREILAATRRSSSSRPGVAAVHAALQRAFVTYAQP